MAMVKIQASSVCFQSAAVESVMPRTLVSGSLKTLKRVGLPDAEMDGEGRRRHQPAVEAGAGDDARSRQ